MRLLFDQNLSRHLVRLLADRYPASSHVAILGLITATDPAIWTHAAAEGYCIVTKDMDYALLAQEQGFPPKVVCLRLGNCPTAEVAALLRRRHAELLDLESDPERGVLVLEG